MAYEGATSEELEENLNSEDYKKAESRLFNDILEETTKLGAVRPTGPSASQLPSGCYNVGDIGPAGGIIIATPNTTNNNTQYYYEISPVDLHQNHHLQYISCPTGTCAYPICEWGFKGITIPTECPVGEGLNNTNATNSYIPNNEYSNSLNAFTLCKQYSLGGYDDWFLPSKDEWALVRDNMISVFNDDCTPLGSSNDPCSVYGETPYWSSSTGDHASNQNCGIYQDFTVGHPDNHKAIICTASSDFKVMRWFDASVRAMRRFTCPYVPPNPVTIPCYDIGSIGPGGGMVFAIPYTGWNNTKYYYEVGLEDLHTGGLTYQNWYQLFQCNPVPPWSSGGISSLVGAEWGLYGNDVIDVNHMTKIDFGAGYKNTLAIDSFPTAPLSPNVATRDIAATLCLNYAAQQQQVFDEGEGWYLPSLFEFWYMFTTVGDNTPYGAQLNLSTSQMNWSSNGYGTNTDGIYWTSSAYNSYQSGTNNPGGQNPGNLPPSFPNQENYAWAFWHFDGVQNNGAPSSPTLIPRCKPLSVRPIRRFVCDDVTVTGGIDYNWRYKTPGYAPPAISNAGSPGFGEFQFGVYDSNGVLISFEMDIFGEGVSDYISGHPWNPTGPTSVYDYEGVFRYNVLSAAGLPTLEPNPNRNQLIPWWPNLWFHRQANPSVWGAGASGTFGTYTISIYDIHENFMGKWEFFSNSGASCGWNSFCDRTMQIKNIIHVQGPNPVVHLTGDEYILIERKNSPSTYHKVNTVDLYNYAQTGHSIRMIDQFTNQPIPGPVPYWKACVEYCPNNTSPISYKNGGCRSWGVSIAPNQILTPDPPWWSPPHGIGSVPWTSAPGTPGNPFSTIGPLKSDCNQIKSLTSGGVCGTKTPWWYSTFRWVSTKMNPTPSSEEIQKYEILNQDCSKDSSYFIEIDAGNKLLTPGEQSNLISNKLNKFVKRIKKKFRK